MHCEIQSDKLKQAILLTEKASSKRTSLPVLSCILIDIKKNGATFRSTNLDVGIEVEIPAKSDGEGLFAVPAQTISSFLSQSDSKSQLVKLESSSGNLNIQVSKSKGVLKTVPPEDFPAIPGTPTDNSVEISTEALIRGLKAVWYSASISSVKPELASVYVRSDGNSIIFAATDSFRLAEKKVVLAKPANFGDMLIPFKNSLDIVRTLEQMGPTVTMSSNKNLVCFEGNGIRITSRMIDGVFPDYQQIIPKGFTTEAVLLKQDMMNALKIATVFSDSFNQIRFSIDPKKGSFVAETRNSDVGENRSDIDAALTGEPIEINFNCKYIADCFQSIDADSVSLQFSGKNKPLVIKPVSGDQTFLYLAMPMNR